MSRISCPESGRPNIKPVILESCNLYLEEASHRLREPERIWHSEYSRSHHYPTVDAFTDEHKLELLHEGSVAFSSSRSLAVRQASSLEAGLVHRSHADLVRHASGSFAVLFS